MITVNSVLPNFCLKSSLLTVSPHNSSSLILYLITAGVVLSNESQLSFFVLDIQLLHMQLQ